MNTQKIILVDAVECFVSEQGEMNEAMHQLLENYPNPKVILTGAPDEKLSMYGLDKVPYEVFSLKQNPPKSDPKYFEMFLSSKNLVAEDVIYFEHSMEAFKSAESVDIKSYLYNPEENDLVALKEFIDSSLSE
jgi:FMN phosphatase YigB (HAD superfamily)